jgi:hypothetical protein
MSTFFKLKQYNTCATFCRRLLELQPDEKVGAWLGWERWLPCVSRCVGAFGVWRWVERAGWPAGQRG